MLNIREPVPHPESVPSIPESNFLKAVSNSGIPELKGEPYVLGPLRKIALSPL